ncbi:hypothetical protein IJ541_10315 [bacterium]|nr:hypothetical protein [bacterium]
MVHIYTGSNTTVPVGMVMDYNNTNPSRGILLYRSLRPDFSNFSPQFNYSNNSFAQAIYRNGPYSLLHPNNTTSLVAQNQDYLA